MTTAYYAMRLVCEANDVLQSSWPDEIKAVELSKEDEELSDDEKIKKAQHIVTEESYQEMKDIIAEEVTNCEAKLIRQTRHYQGNAMTIFSSMYSKLQIGIVLMVILMIGSYVMIRRLIVKPLISYDESIKLGEILPVIGAVELTKVLAVKNGFDLGVLRADVRNDPAGTILAFIINKKDLIVIIRAVLPNLIPHRLIDGAGVLLLVIGRDHNRDDFFLLAHAGFIPLSLVFGPLPQ